MESNSNKLTEVEEFVCPSCGAGLTYDPASGMLSCAHCGSKQTVCRTVTNLEKDFFGAVAEDCFSSDEAVSYRCSSCGAVTLMSKGEIAGICPFCGMASVVEAEEQAGIKPTAVIPFGFDRVRAAELYRKWIKRKIFAPRKLKRNFKADKVSSVYIPCWTYDTVTTSTYRGRLGKYYTVVVGSGKKKRVVTRVRWYTVSGTYNKSFDDVTIEATSHLDQREFDRLAPYDTNNACDYDPKYLAGSTAERYRMGIADAFDIAKEKMNGEIRRDILGKYNADVVDYLDLSVCYNEVRYKYVLLPVWMCSFRYGKKKRSYGFFVNGQTGRTSGKFPVSVWRVLFASTLAIGALVGLILLL